MIPKAWPQRALSSGQIRAVEEKGDRKDTPVAIGDCGEAEDGWALDSGMGARKDFLQRRKQNQMPKMEKTCVSGMLHACAGAGQRPEGRQCPRWEAAGEGDSHKVFQCLLLAWGVPLAVLLFMLLQWK